MKTISKIAFAALALLAAAACNKHEIDNKKSNYNATMEISASGQTVVLDESAPDATALTISWTPAYDYGSDFIMTYRALYNVEPNQFAFHGYDTMNCFISICHEFGRHAGYRKNSKGERGVFARCK